MVNRGVKRFVYAVSVFALVLVGVFASTRTMSAYDYPIDENTRQLTLENISDINNLSTEITTQALKINPIAVDDLLAYWAVNQYYYVKYCGLLELQNQLSNAYPVSTVENAQLIIQEAANFYFMAYSRAEFSTGLMGTNKLINDNASIGPLDCYALLLNYFEDTTTDYIAIIPIAPLVQVVETPTKTHNYSLAYYYCEKNINSGVSIPYVNQLVIIDYFVEYHNVNIQDQLITTVARPTINTLQYNDDGYYYYYTAFNTQQKIIYGVDIANSLKDYLISIGEYEAFAQELQSISNMADNVTYIYNIVDKASGDSTYQDGYKLGWDTGYNQGVQDTSGKTFKELGWYNWIIGIFDTMAMFLSLKIGDIYIGYFCLIPLIISVVAFIIRMWKGGQGD